MAADISLLGKLAVQELLMFIEPWKIPRPPNMP